jgi:hypothetical protein
MDTLSAIPTTCDVVRSATYVLNDWSAAVLARLAAKPFGELAAVGAEVENMEIELAEGSVHRLVRRDLASAVGVFAVDGRR